MLDVVVSKADFARRCGVTRGRVSQWIRDGQIGGEALDGTGPRARIRADVALGMLRGRLDWFRAGSVADLGGSRGDVAAQKFQAAVAKTRAAVAHAELMEMKAGRESGKLVLKSAVDASIEAFGRATRNAYMSIVGWSEELYGAGQAGGLGAHTAMLRAKAIEFGHLLADLVLAEAAKSEPPDQGVENG
jgi:hypothetical protein